MKKTRNSFFQESNYQSYNPYLNNGQAPFQSASNYFYQGPMPNNNIPNNYNINNNDLESRLAKIERQINRLDYRVSKLENNNVSSSLDDNFNNSNTNMYMV